MIPSEWLESWIRRWRFVPSIRYIASGEALTVDGMRGVLRICDGTVMSTAGFDLSTLSNHLWESANILRGPVDAADFKTYIFPLLFFKRISDVFDEEIADALDESGGDQQYALFPENHRFQIPDDCHWADVRKKTTNVGQGLQRAMREIEKANPDTLYGIFGDAQWTNKDRLSDALLRDLIEHFSKLPLGNKAARADVLGQSYEYLIKKFADATNKKAGEFYTPRSVVRLMVHILDPREGETIYDPACGTGGMLIEAIHHVREAGGNIRTLWGKLFGQEKNLTTSAIARMNLFLHGVEDFQVVRGDTLRQPAFLTGDSLATFDCVIANPPFSLEKWGDEVWSSDPYGRNFAGMPPAKSGDYAWVQHMIKSMAPKSGRMAVVLPHGALFRMGSRRQDSSKAARHGHPRRRHRPRTESFLRHRPCRLHPGLPPEEVQRPPQEGADRRCLEGVQEGPRPERTAPGTRQPHLSVVRRLPGCGRCRPAGLA